MIGDDSGNQNAPTHEIYENSFQCANFGRSSFALSGCVWLRLLEAKNQLADFDRNVRVSIDEDTFILIF